MNLKQILEIFQSILTLFCCGAGILFALVAAYIGKGEVLDSAQRRREKLFHYLFKKEIDDSWDQK